jgi:hypothetical protein
VPVTPTYPGVYIEEIPSGVHPITGVATSIAAFVDFFPRGEMNTAVQVFGFGDFERQFGGLDDRSEASYAIQQFFLNGGTQAWVVRAASAAATTLSAALAAGATSIDVGDTSAFAPSGSLVIESEIVLYNGKDATSFQNCVRGAAGSTAASHANNLPVTQAPTKATINVEDGVGGGAATAGVPSVAAERSRSTRARRTRSRSSGSAAADLSVPPASSRARLLAGRRASRESRSATSSSAPVACRSRAAAARHAAPPSSAPSRARAWASSSCRLASASS